MHHCLLPKKKYVYLTAGAAFTNPAKEFLFGLQGLGPVNIHGLQSRLSFSDCQDLLGNAFTSNVIAVVGLGVLVHVLN